MRLEILQLLKIILQREIELLKRLQKIIQEIENQLVTILVHLVDLPDEVVRLQPEGKAIVLVSFFKLLGFSVKEFVFLDIY